MFSAQCAAATRILHAAAGVGALYVTPSLEAAASSAGSDLVVAAQVAFESKFRKRYFTF
jgi:hypothetical protein